MPAPSEEPAEDSEPIVEPNVPVGFKVTLHDEDDTDDDEYEDKPARGFFRRKR